MINITVSDHLAFLAFWVAFGRWLGVLIHLPILDDVSIPVLVKILISLVLTMAFFPMTRPILVAELNQVGVKYWWALSIFHLIVGLGLGLIVKSIMNIFVSSGMIMSQQIGLGAAKYFDPSLALQVGPFERLLHLTVLLMVISSGAMLPMLKGALMSFQTMGINAIFHEGELSSFFLSIFKGIFVASVLLSTPILFTNLILSVIMGIMARTIPQMNVLMVSFIVNIAVGFFVFTLGSGEFFQVAYKTYVDYLGKWFSFVS